MQQLLVNQVSLDVVRQEERAGRTDANAKVRAVHERLEVRAFHQANPGVSRQLTPQKLDLHPLIALTLDWAWFGEALGGIETAGAVLVLGGLYLVLSAGRSRRGAATT